MEVNDREHDDMVSDDYSDYSENNTNMGMTSDHEYSVEEQ